MSPFRPTKQMIPARTFSPGTALLAKAGRWGSKRFESESDPWSWPWTSPLLALSLQEALLCPLASLLAEHQREILWPHKKAPSFLNACLYWTLTRFEPNFGGHCWHHCNALATFLLEHITTSVTNLLHDTISLCLLRKYCWSSKTLSNPDSSVRPLTAGSILILLCAYSVRTQDHTNLVCFNQG